MKKQIACKFLKDDNCTSVMKDGEGKETRQEECQNNNKSACCYACLFSYNHSCEISCEYLGEVKKICSLCGSEMYHDHMELRIGGWIGLTKILPSRIGELGEIGEDKLPVIVYLCSKCNKLEFFAEEKAKRLFWYWFKKGKPKR